MTKFYGREAELKQLNSRYEGGRFECVIVYGRRRIGKTALINEFCKGKPTLFFSALNSTARENLEALSKAIFAYQSPGATSAPVFPDYFAALDRITALAKRERFVLVIDEYPRLAKAYPAIASMLQHRIDREWSDTGLFLILCGSSMNFMENQVLGVESPLFGRRTAQLRLQPLDFREAALFHPELSFEENALIYGVTGGVPHYIKKLDVRGSVAEALVENLFDSSADLYEEPANLLRQELRDPAPYAPILRAIAHNVARVSEIAKRTGASTALLSNHLKTLEELCLIRHETIAMGRPGRKTVLYEFQDGFFRFWCRFVPQNLSAIEAGRFPGLYPEVVRRHLPDFMGPVFRQMCELYLLKYAERLPYPLRSVGRWRGMDPIQKQPIQIDLVGKGVETRRVLVGACQYQDTPMDTPELELLQRNATYSGQGRRYDYCLFSKGGFTDGMREAAGEAGAMLFTLEDLYKKG